MGSIMNIGRGRASMTVACLVLASSSAFANEGTKLPVVHIDIPEIAQFGPRLVPSSSSHTQGFFEGGGVIDVDQPIGFVPPPAPPEQELILRNFLVENPRFSETTYSTVPAPGMIGLLVAGSAIFGARRSRR